MYLEFNDYVVKTFTLPTNKNHYWYDLQGSDYLSQQTFKAVVFFEIALHSVHSLKLVKKISMHCEFKKVYNFQPIRRNCWYKITIHAHL